MYSATVILGIAVWIACVSAQPDECTNFLGLPNVERRGTNIPFEIATQVCDQFLSTTTYYRIDQNLPTEKVDINFCGTASPIWLRGSLPTTLYESINSTTCTNRGFDLGGCDNENTVTITNCGTYNVYLLFTTDCPSGFCINATTSGVFNVNATFAPAETTTEQSTTGLMSSVVSTAVPTSSVVSTAVPTSSAVSTAVPTSSEVSTAVSTVSEAPSTTNAIPENCTSTGLRPWVTSLSDGGLCDLAASTCVTPEATLHQNSPVEDTAGLQCRLRRVSVGESGPYETVGEVMVGAIFRDCNTVVCPIPNATIPVAGGPYITGWHVAVSNTNQEFGAEKFFLPHDSTCITCTIVDAVPSCTILDTHCFINGECIPDGADNPDRVGCETCNVNVTNSNYTPLGAGQVCLVNGTCYPNGTGPTNDTCLVCDVSQNTAALTINEGHCFVNNTCFSDGETNPFDVCDRCNSSLDATSFTLPGSSCVIDNQCYADGTTNPSNRCERCDFGASNSTWTPGGLLDRIDGRTITCSGLCQHVALNTNNYLMLVCALGGAIQQSGFDDMCVLQDRSSLPPSTCPGFETEMTNWVAMCLHGNAAAAMADTTICPLNG